MNRLEMIYQDSRIEIYYKCNLLYSEYYLTNKSQVIARIYPFNYGEIEICVKRVHLDDLNTFSDVVINYIAKAL